MDTCKIWAYRMHYTFFFFQTHVMSYHTYSNSQTATCLPYHQNSKYKISYDELLYMQLVEQIFLRFHKVMMYFTVFINAESGIVLLLCQENCSMYIQMLSCNQCVLL